MITQKVCTKCQASKPMSGFYFVRSRGAPMAACKSCSKACTTRHQVELQKRGSITTPDFKKCTACHIEKPASEFHASRSAVSGLLSRCKACYKAARAARLPKSPPAAKLCTKCRVSKPGTEFHTDARNASGIQSHCKACVNARRYAHNTTPRGFAQKKQSDHRRRVIKRIVPSDVTPEAWAQLLEAFSHRCAYCLQPDNDLQIDHVEPLAKGGQHVIDNIVPACIRCNGSKCDRTLLQCLLTPHLLVTQEMLAS